MSSDASSLEVVVVEFSAWIAALLFVRIVILLLKDKAAISSLQATSILKYSVRNHILKNKIVL